MLLATSSSSRKTHHVPCEFSVLSRPAWCRIFCWSPSSRLAQYGMCDSECNSHRMAIEYIHTVLPTCQLSLQTPPAPFFGVALMWQWDSIECCNQFHTISSVWLEWLESDVSFPSHLFGWTSIPVHPSVRLAVEIINPRRICTSCRS